MLNYYVCNYKFPLYKDDVESVPEIKKNVGVRVRVNPFRDTFLDITTGTALLPCYDSRRKFHVLHTANCSSF